MKRVAILVMLLALPWLAAAVEDGQVVYVGGTVPAMKEGVAGRLKTNSETMLSFEYSGGTGLAIPFAKIESYEYSQQAARHLGVLPGVAVALVKRRQKRHYFKISFRDDRDAQQVAIFEVPKQMPRTLLAILQSRAPQGCKPLANAKCSEGSW